MRASELSIAAEEKLYAEMEKKIEEASADLAPLAQQLAEAEAAHSEQVGVRDSCYAV